MGGLRASLDDLFVFAVWFAGLIGTTRPPISILNDGAREHGIDEFLVPGIKRGGEARGDVGLRGSQIMVQ